MLQLRRAELEQRIGEDRARLASVEARLRGIEEEGATPDDVSIKSLPAQRVVAIRRPAPGFGHENLAELLYAAFDDLNQVVERAAIPTKRPSFTCYSGDPAAGTLIAYACVPVTADVMQVEQPAEVLIVPAVPAAAVVVREGTAVEVYSKSRVYSELVTWLEAHDYVPAGAGRDVFVDDRHRRPNDPTVFQIQLPVRRPNDPLPDLTPQLAHAVPTHER